MRELVNNAHFWLLGKDGRQFHFPKRAAAIVHGPAGHRLKSACSFDSVFTTVRLKIANHYIDALCLERLRLLQHCEISNTTTAASLRSYFSMQARQKSRWLVRLSGPSEDSSESTLVHAESSAPVADTIVTVAFALNTKAIFMDWSSRPLSVKWARLLDWIGQRSDIPFDVHYLVSRRASLSKMPTPQVFLKDPCDHKSGGPGRAFREIDDRQNTCFVIPTYRLRDVGETVEEYDEHFWRNGHSPKIIVFDDSTPVNQGKYHTLLERTTTHLDGILRWISREGAISFVFEFQAP